MPTFVTGGTERLVFDLVQRLDSTRLSASVCVFENGLLGEDLAKRGYVVHCLVGTGETPGGLVRRLGALIRRVAALRRIAKAERVDIVHSHFLGPGLHAYLAGIPSRHWTWVHTEHARPDVIAGYPPWLRHAGHWLMRAADVVTGVSDGVARYLRERARIPASRIRVMVNGIDVERFSRPADRQTKRQEIGLPSDAWVIGTVGNLRIEKNQELVLRALPEVLREIPEACVVLVGGGERRARLEALARELNVKDRALFLGARMDVPDLFATFDVYCLPSHFEGMPLSVLEAMAARKPIVGTRVPGIEDLIVDNVTGLLIPANDATALGQTVARLHRDRALSDRLVEAAWEYVNTHARLETMVQGYSDLYEEVARPSARGKR
jgi:glycosyltransferase involved in cell wall biosynthesis